MTRAVLVTGGAAGIGWATARRFAADGDAVMIADVDGARARERAAALGPGHHAVEADLSTPDGPGAAVAACLSRLGRLDVLVNNAGRIDASGLAIVDQTLEAFGGLIALNLLGVERASMAAAAAMRRQGGGVVVNVASAAALRAIPLRSGYSASKAGVVALTREMGAALAREGIRVNAVAPGYTRTELVDALVEAGRVDLEAASRRIPLGRPGAPEEIAAAIRFLASPGARGIVGALLVVDGGSMAFGGADASAVPRLHPPVAAPPGREVIAVTGADTRLGRGVVAALSARGVAAVPLAGPAAAVRTRHGRLDGLVNAAGSDGLLGEGTVAGHLAEHLEATFLASRDAGRIFLEQGFGSVVNLTSVAGQAGLAGRASGAAAAAAVGMFTRSLCCEWCGSGVRANAIAAGVLPGDDPALLARVPSGRHTDPVEVGEAAAFLLSPDAGYVDGIVLPVDGGLGCYGGRDLEGLGGGAPC